jgi:hypothetical protein
VPTRYNRDLRVWGIFLGEGALAANSTPIPTADLMFYGCLTYPQEMRHRPAPALA